MTVQLDVQTAFEDISALAAGYVERVDGTYLVLPAGVEIADGEWVQFAVKLVDGSVALEGVGKAAGQRDHGAEYGAERFDLWLTELQLGEGMSEVTWERINLAREQQQGGDRATGEVDLRDVEAARAAEAAPAAGGETWEKDGATATYEEGGFSPEAAGEVEVADMDAEATVAAPTPASTSKRERAAPPAAKPAPPPPSPSGLTRPTAAVSWHPVADPPRGTGQGSGVFEYGDEGLPVPPGPPRPEGEVPRIEAAPRPAAG